MLDLDLTAQGVDARLLELTHGQTSAAFLRLLTRLAPAVPKCRVVFADPPYDQGVRYADDPTGDRLGLPEYQRMTRDAIASGLAIAEPGATFWWLVPERFADWVGPMLTDRVGPRLYRVVWEEAFAQYQGDRKLTEDYRFLFVHRVPGGDIRWNPKAIKIPSARQERYKDKRANPEGRVPGCVWRVRRLQGTSKDHVDWHPCQLPPEMLERIVLGWSDPGDVVADLFAGSGNMGLAALKHGRRFVGIDRSPTYIREMAARLTSASKGVRDVRA